jgi:IS5 family transposase
MFRTIGDRPSLWESRLPAEVLRLPEDLARVDVLLDDPVFFAPFAPYFQPVIGRPSTPVECYPRLMFLKFRHRLGFESLCAEVSDSISWRRFCRIPLDAKVPHPATLMKLTSRCGEAAVAGLNEALWAKAAGDKLLRTTRVRADTTVICANVAYPTDSGLLAKAVGKLVRTARRVRAAGGAPATAMTDRRPSSSGTKPRSPTTTTASSSTTTSNTAPLPTARNLRPPSSGSTAAPAARRAVTADRGYGRAAFERDLHDLGRAHRGDSPPGQDLSRPQQTRAQPQLPPPGQVAHRLRRADQLPQARLRIGPHPPGHQARSRDLVRARGLRPQPGQDRSPGQLTPAPPSDAREDHPAVHPVQISRESFFRSK